MHQTGARECSSYWNFYDWWRRVETEAGVRHRKPHMTRHTFATDVLDATEGNLYAVKELLGHSSTTGHRDRICTRHGRIWRPPSRLSASTGDAYSSKTVISMAAKSLQISDKKATSGFEPLYEALQASA